MRHPTLKAACLAMLLAAPAARAESQGAVASSKSGGAPSEWGLGFEAGAQPALSVQWLLSPDAAYHTAVHLSDRGAAVSLDYQRFFVPPFGRGDGWTLKYYAGLGLGGQDTRGSSQETYAMRLPVGAQVDLSMLHLSVFAEAAGEVGPLPETGAGVAVAGGLRTRF